MKIKEVKRVEKKYICENCGTSHKRNVDVFKSFFSEKEICKKCAVKVKLYRIDWEDFIEVNAHKDDIKQGYDSWETEYVSAIRSVEEEMYEKIKEINKKYISKDEDYFRKFIAF